MKKTLCLWVCLLSVLPTIARGTITLKSGDASVWKLSEEAVVVFDYSKAELEGKDISLEEHLEKKGIKFETQWERAQEMAHKDFIKRYNKKSTGLKLVAEGSETTKYKYKVVIQVRTINLGNTMKSLVPVGVKTDGGANLFGRIYVTDNDGNELCVLKFGEIKGLGTTALEVRMMYAYQELQNTLLKYLNKSQSSKSKDDEEEEEEE